MMVRVLVLRVGWTQAFSGSCPYCLSPLISVSCLSSVFFFFVLSSFFLSIFFVLCILPSPGSFSPSVFVLLFFFSSVHCPAQVFSFVSPLVLATFRSLAFIAREQCRFFQPLIAGVMVAVGVR
jgi:hypothetical protein